VSMQVPVLSRTTTILLGTATRIDETAHNPP
jgi:hypothetical protein